MRSPPLTTSELVTVQRIDTFTYLAGDMNSSIKCYQNGRNSTFLTSTQKINQDKNKTLCFAAKNVQN
jgi:hypothetical protein